MRFLILKEKRYISLLFSIVLIICLAGSALGSGFG